MTRTRTTAPGLAPGAAPTVRGLDLSLTGAGVADARWAVTHGTTGHRADPYTVRRARLHGMADDLLDTVGRPTLAVVEGPSYGSTGSGTWDRAGLWWLVVDRLYARGIPVAVVSPSARAKYATGNGRSAKADVLAAVRARYPVRLDDDNQGDAYALCAMGHDWLGAPLATVPETHRSALARVEWPDLLAPPPSVQLALDRSGRPYGAVVRR